MITNDVPKRRKIWRRNLKGECNSCATWRLSASRSYISWGVESLDGCAVFTRREHRFHGTFIDPQRNAPTQNDWMSGGGVPP